MLTTASSIRLGSFYEFYVHYRVRVINSLAVGEPLTCALQWLFTLGLVLSTALDIMITSSLCLYLRKSRHGGSGR